MRTEISPSGRYKLEISLTKKFKGYWQWGIGKITNNITGEFISVIHRNYPAFWFTWAENHANGHDYLLAGEDYQGQTIIQLDTGLRKDYIPTSAENGAGFCWVEVEYQDDDRELVVYGCYWGAPFEYVRYDFVDPFNLPYPEMERWEEEE